MVDDEITRNINHQYVSSKHKNIERHIAQGILKCIGLYTRNASFLLIVFQIANPLKIACNYVTFSVLTSKQFLSTWNTRQMFYA